MKKGRTVTLDSDTLERIRDLGRMGEAYDSVINRALDEVHSVRNTRVLLGRKRILGDIFDRRLVARHTFYSVSGEELASSYRPFLPLLKTSIEQLGGSSKILTDIGKGTLNAVNQLVTNGAEVRHLENRLIRRCVIYDNEVAYFSILEKPLVKSVDIDAISEAEGYDMWTRSTQSDIVKSVKDIFLSDWSKAMRLEKRIKDLEDCKLA